MSRQLLWSQMALCHLFEGVQSKLLGFHILGLSPVHKQGHKLLALVLELEDLCQKIRLPLERHQRLRLEIQRVQNSLLHLLVVGGVHAVGVIQEVFLEKHARYLSDLFLLVCQIGNEQLEQLGRISLSLSVELSLGSGTHSVV